MIAHSLWEQNSFFKEGTAKIEYGDWIGSLEFSESFQKTPRWTLQSASASEQGALVLEPSLSLLK